LRYESPVQFFGRTVLEDVTINGQLLRKGQGLFILPGAINRDPEQFSDPEHLDVTRRENRHLAFGYGIHFCLGGPLARLEGQIAINAILQLMPTLKLGTTSIEWQDITITRGLKALPVVV
jgi:cytochrome P450